MNEWTNPGMNRAREQVVVASLSLLRGPGQEEVFLNLTFLKFLSFFLKFSWYSAKFLILVFRVGEPGKALATPLGMNDEWMNWSVKSSSVPPWMGGWWWIWMNEVRNPWSLKALDPEAIDRSGQPVWRFQDVNLEVNEHFAVFSTIMMEWAISRWKHTKYLEFDRRSLLILNDEGRYYYFLLGPEFCLHNNDWKQELWM